MECERGGTAGVGTTTVPTGVFARVLGNFEERVDGRIPFLPTRNTSVQSVPRLNNRMGKTKRENIIDVRNSSTPEQASREPRTRAQPSPSAAERFLAALPARASLPTAPPESTGGRPPARTCAPRTDRSQARHPSPLRTAARTAFPRGAPPPPAPSGATRGAGPARGRGGGRGPGRAVQGRLRRRCGARRSGTERSETKQAGLCSALKAPRPRPRRERERRRKERKQSGPAAVETGRARRSRICLLSTF